MGAVSFMVVQKGASAGEAFRAAREAAAYEHGHGGYTGTIAEKPGFRMRTVREATLNDFIEKAREKTQKRLDFVGALTPSSSLVHLPDGSRIGFVNQAAIDSDMKCSRERLTAEGLRRQALYDYADSIIEENEKWGDAFCLELGGNEYLFFGYASY